MEAEQLGGLGDVPLAIFEDAVDVLPFGAGERGDVEGEIRQNLWGEGGQDLVGVGGLGEVVGGAEAHGFDGGCDAPITCEHDDAGGGVDALDRLESEQTVVVGHLEVNNCKLWGVALGNRNGVRVVGGGEHIVTSTTQGGREPFAENVVVIDEEDGAEQGVCGCG